MSNVTFYDRIEEAAAHPEKHAAVGSGAQRLLARRAQAVAIYDEMDEMRDRGRLIRAHTLSRLDHYLAQFINNVEKLGGHVFLAGDAAEANAYITKLAREKGVRSAVKSKSMVTEEIHLNDALEKAGVRPIESDLGEYIIQLADERPSHIIAPVMHRTRQDVGKLFSEKLDVDYTEDPLVLNQIARSKLRQEFLEADMGISGVNFAVADSGTISIVTNEGNARMSTTAPPIHVAVMGMERIVPTFEELGIMLQILARSATGQKLSVYATMITGPRRPGDDDGPEEFHVVIVDNGRSQTLGSELAEILYCIRCGACLNTCPVYQSIGGHAYGSVYPGPIGSVLTPALDGVGPWGELAHASTLCGACKEVCPV
ncbi:MAG: LutB/LldF family L-lactate oxidation iron-sulfur protein, partial [Ardenticatenaceae bacterium]|nr:LutB/LldF family L-lactate oxidation iron-sulfur protein [Ardenticatenaceae bacterium]